MIQQFHSYFPQTSENTCTPKYAKTSVSACSVAQLCLALCNPMDCSRPVSPVHGIFQARILEWVVIPSSGDPGTDWTWVSWIAIQEDSLLSEPLGNPLFIHCPQLNMQEPGCFMMKSIHLWIDSKKTQKQRNTIATEVVISVCLYTGQVNRK